MFPKQLLKNIELAADKIVTVFKHGGKLLVCGNGGSAADSNHFAAELVCKYKRVRRALPAVSLAANMSIITAIGNDYDFNKVFSRQIEALGEKKDILFAISTSGNSSNIIEALKQAKKQRLYTIGLSGVTSGKMKNLCDLMLCVPSKETPRIQESHILIIHIICDLIERVYAK